ncbi:MAG: c-type cytochrome domain-containing protein [Nannocystaceae bacterium]
MKSRARTNSLLCALALGTTASQPAGCDVLVDTEEQAAVPDDGGVAPAAGNAITFSSTIKPVLDDYCGRCHNASTQSGGVDLSSQRALIDTGVVVPGDADRSRIVRVLQAGAMPPPGQPRPPQEAVSWLRGWIADGALNN